MGCAAFSHGQTDIEVWIVLAAGTVAMGETLRRGPPVDCKVDGPQWMSLSLLLRVTLWKEIFFFPN